MTTNLKTVVTNHLRARTAAQGTREAYSATVKKWEQWGKGAALEQIGRKEILGISRLGARACGRAGWFESRSHCQ